MRHLRKEFNAMDLTKNYTMMITLHGAGRRRLRLRIAMWLVRLACWLASVGLEYVETGRQEQ